MLPTIEKRIFLLVYCLVSVLQGMYSTYFVSILTTLERLYQIQSKTAGIVLSATELGQILGSLLIAYYGGKGNKPRWIAFCTALIAIAAITITSPHFLLDAPGKNNRDLNLANLNSQPELLILETNPSSKLNLPSREQLCSRTIDNSTHRAIPLSVSPSEILQDSSRDASSKLLVFTIFYLCLLTIGFGSTAITTLGIPYIDDIFSKEESPIYLGLTIGLRIFGPALGFLLGSFCIGLDAQNLPAFASNQSSIESHAETLLKTSETTGVWWLGLILISTPLLLLAIPMYYLSRSFTNDTSSSMSCENLDEVTYKPAEDHDIGGSRDFQPHILGLSDPIDVTSNRTFYSDIDASSSREALQARSPLQFSEDCNFINSLAISQPIVSRDGALIDKLAKVENPEPRWVSNCLIVNHFGELESTKLAESEVELNEALIFDQAARNSFSSVSTCAKIKIAPPSSSASLTISSAEHSVKDLSSSLAHLIRNKLLVMRMLSGILHILPIAGFYTFLPKYLIEYYQLEASSASAVSGLAGILFVGLGAFLGGTIMRVMSVNSRLMTKWIAASALLYTLGMLIMMNLSCPQNELTVYHGNQYAGGLADNINQDINQCFSACDCSSSVFSPICSKGITYLSPCLAGCRGYSMSSKDDNKILFDECDCSSMMNWLRGHRASENASLAASVNGQLDDQDEEQDERPRQGHCLVNCDNLKWYIMVFSLFTLVHASSEVGSMMFNLRCVRKNERTLALGLLTFSSSLLGKIDSNR